MGWILAIVSFIGTLWVSTWIGPLAALGLWITAYVIGSMVSKHIFDPDEAYYIERYGKRHRESPPPI